MRPRLPLSTPGSPGAPAHPPAGSPAPPSVPPSPLHPRGLFGGLKSAPRRAGSQELTRTPCPPGWPGPGGCGRLRPPPRLRAAWSCSPAAPRSGLLGAVPPSPLARSRGLSGPVQGHCLVCRKRFCRVCKCDRARVPGGPGVGTEGHAGRVDNRRGRRGRSGPLPTLPTLPNSLFPSLEGAQTWYSIFGGFRQV